jgi:hypothetical protein
MQRAIVHLDNNWYGHRAILSSWCGVSDRPAYATILHGWIWEVEPDRGKRRFSSAPYLLWNEKQLRQARSNKLSNAEAIGAPFLYLCRQENQESQGSEGTLLFPQHHTDHNSAAVSHERLIKIVEERYPAPYTVSLFYKEPNLEALRALYAKAGWSVFTAGSRSDPDFLRNLRACLIRHDRVVSNDFSTAILYAAYLGKFVQIMEDQLWARSIYNRYSLDQEFIGFARSLFSGIEGESAKKIASRELGDPCVKSRADLKRILGWDSKWRSRMASVVARLVDIKYGSEIRSGEMDLAGK